MLAAAALVIIAATVSFQHDTPIYQAAYAANNPDIYLFNASKYDPPRSFTGAYNKVEINSYGYVFILHQNRNLIEKYLPYNAGTPGDPDDPPDTYLKRIEQRDITGLRTPHSFDIDPVDNNLVVLNYVSVGGKNYPQIKILDHNGNPRVEKVSAIGGANHPHLVAPKDVAVSSSADRIYVIDKDSGTGKYTRITIYNYTDGAFISEFGSYGNAFTNWHAEEYMYKFNILDAIATNPDGDIIIADRTKRVPPYTSEDWYRLWAGRIMVYDQDGNWKRTIFPIDDACDPKSFFRVYDIDTDAYGNMFIGDRYRVMVLDPTGRLLSHFWGVGNPPYEGDNPGNIYHKDLHRRGNDVPVQSVAVGPHETPPDPITGETKPLDPIIIIGQSPYELKNMLVFEGLPLHDEDAMNEFLEKYPLPCAVPEEIPGEPYTPPMIVEQAIDAHDEGPKAIAFDSEGNMYVVQFHWWDVNQEGQNPRGDKLTSAANKISIYDRDGKHVKTIGSAGTITLDSNKNTTEGYLALPDKKQPDCFKYDPDEDNYANFYNDYCFDNPRNIWIDRTGGKDTIYVPNSWIARAVNIYNSDLELVGLIDMAFYNHMRNLHPHGLTTGGPNNYLYVMMAGNHPNVTNNNAIHVFNQTELLEPIDKDDPSKGYATLTSDEVLPAGHVVTVRKLDDLSPAAQWHFPQGIAVNSTGHMFVVSTYNLSRAETVAAPWPSTNHVGAVDVYSPIEEDNGVTHLKEVLMRSPDHIALDPHTQNIYVSDYYGISIFDPNMDLIEVVSEFMVYTSDECCPSGIYEDDYEPLITPTLKNELYNFRQIEDIAFVPGGPPGQIAVAFNEADKIGIMTPYSTWLSSMQPSSKRDYGGSNDYDYITAPTFGLSHDTRSSTGSRLIDSGISLNGFALDVGSFHTEFARQILQTGQDNTLSTKVKTSTGGYGGLKIIEFFYGVPRIGALSQAEGSIEVHIDPYDRGEFPEITDLAIRDNRHSLLSEGDTTVTVQRVDCIKGDAKKGCYKIDIGFVFANTPVGEVFALQATDSRGWSTTEYFNDGFEVQGAPLAPVTMSIAADLARGAGKGSTEVTQIDRKKDLWLSADDNTTLYTKNDFGFWKKLTPDKPLNRCSQDTEYDTKEWNVMTRMHCLHGAQTESEAKRAQSVFNSSAIQKELPPGSFAHEPPLTIDHRSALLHKLGWITTDDVIKRIELSGKYDHMDGQQLKDEVHQLLLLEDKDADDADAVNIADASNADTGAAALVTPGQSTAVIDKINSEITSLKEQFEAHSLILAQIHSALADLSDVLTQQKQELELYSSNESELLGAMLQQQQQQQQHTLLYFLPLLSAALAAVPCLFYFRRYAKAKAKTVQVMTGEQQQQKLKSYDSNNNNAKSQLQQMQQKLEEKHQKLKRELEEKHQKTQQAQHERLQQTQQKLEELQESKQKLQESEHEKLQQTQQKLEELQESKQKLQESEHEKLQQTQQKLEELQESRQQTQQELEEKHQKLQQTQQKLEELQESRQKTQQELEEKHQKLQQTQQEKLQQTQQKLEELQESKQQMQQELEEKHQKTQQELEEKHQKLQQTQQEKLQQTQQKLEELQESKQQTQQELEEKHQKTQQELEEKHQKLQQTQQEKLQQTQQKLEELQESKQQMQQELEEKHQKTQQELEEKHQKLQQTQQEKLQQTQQKLEELQESKQQMQQKLEEKQQQELEEKQQEQQNTPADLSNNAEIYEKIDELLGQKKRK